MLFSPTKYRSLSFLKIHLPYIYSTITKLNNNSGNHSLIFKISHFSMSYSPTSSSPMLSLKGETAVHLQVCLGEKIQHAFDIPCLYFLTNFKKPSILTCNSGVDLLSFCIYILTVFSRSYTAGR